MAILLQVLIILLSITVAFSQDEEPNLHDLLVGVENCEVQIIHKSNLGTPSSAIHHFHSLPTTIINISHGTGSYSEMLIGLLTKLKFDIFQGHAPFFRISYTFINQPIPKDLGYWQFPSIISAFTTGSLATYSSSNIQSTGVTRKW